MQISKSVARSMSKTYENGLANGLEGPESMQRALEALKDEFGRGICRPVCVKCGCELRPERNGVGLLIMADFGPYKLYDADKHKCPKCGVEIVAGLGANAISEHFEASFERLVQSYRDKAEVVEVR